MLFFELAIVLILTVLNGVLAMCELAVFSARRPKLKAMAEQGSRGAEAALKLTVEPGRFLSTVQIGITLISILTGVFSGAAFGEPLEAVLLNLGAPKTAANVLGYGVVVLAMTYLSLVIGELVPKQLALRHAEAIAAAFAIPMTTIANAASPLVALLDGSGKFVLRLFGRAREGATTVTEEEIKTMVAEAEHAGVLEPEERRMIAGVLRLGDRAVRAVMTPRLDVDILDLSLPVDAALKFIAESDYVRLPVSEGNKDDILGIIYSKDLLDAYIAGKPVDPKTIIRPAPIIPDTMDALEALNVLRESPVHMALVHDEYGHFQGVVTTMDILASIAGEFRTEEDEDEPDVVERADGSYLLSGSMRVDETVELLGLKLDPGRNYSTVAGLVLHEMHHLPKVGETIVVSGWRFEVVDLDGRRIDKVLVQRLPPGHRVKT
jgi:putative hemolysin